MAGRIKDDDIQLVRERARLDEVIEQYVTLRNAGGGARKGLCPFHDEKTPSFNVRPAQGFYHCFGCGASGDVFTFLREIEGIGFVEAVERLAAKYGIQLRYEEGAPSGPRRDPRLRSRLLEAHRLAQEFYAQALASSSEAVPARQFVTDRGFDQATAERFGMGFAPRTGEALSAHLRAKGFSDDELVTGGLSGRGSRGLYDRFRGRLVWPIRELSGEVIGFGARRLFDDDHIEAKYLNTTETPIYKKSQVLYGLDLARREIASSNRAVIVEGYTDVMACHVAGVPTAVATCGTAFGADHARTLRRIMGDHDSFHGEVIFTFDGDEAGQRAAMKAFEGDEQFVAQTYVAVEPRGMDPCDLRLADGDAAVRELVATRIPLYRFVLDNMLARYDLDRGDQRVDAVREAAGLTRAIRDPSKVDAFLREVATLVGADVDEVRAEHRRLKNRPAPSRGPARRAEAPAGQPGQGQPGQGQPGQGDTALMDAPATPPAPSLGEPQFTGEREALKAIIQFPHLAAPHVADLDDNDFTHPTARVLWQHVHAAGLPSEPDPTWAPRVSEGLDGDEQRRIFALCTVDPLRASEQSTPAVVASLIARLQEITTARRIEEVKSKLQRTNPVDEAESYNRMFGELVALEQQRRELRARAIGDDS